MERAIRRIKNPNELSSKGSVNQVDKQKTILEVSSVVLVPG